MNSAKLWQRRLGQLINVPLKKAGSYMAQIKTNALDQMRQLIDELEQLGVPPKDTVIQTWIQELETYKALRTMTANTKAVFRD